MRNASLYKYILSFPRTFPDPILTLRIVVVSLEFLSHFNANITDIAAVDILGFLGYLVARLYDVVFISRPVHDVRADANANAIIGGDMHFYAEMPGVSFLALGHFGIPAVRRFSLK